MHNARSKGNRENIPSPLRGAEVIGWGTNWEGPTDVPEDLTDVVSIAAGERHSLALRADGTVVAWGGNLHGETDIPEGVTNVAAIAAGDTFSLALIGSGPPVETMPMVNRSAMTGGVTVFHPSMTGEWPLSYQWFHNGEALVGETKAWLVLRNVQPEQAGAYTLSASNRWGSATSAPAELTVHTLVIKLVRQTDGSLVLEWEDSHMILQWTEELDTAWHDLPEARSPHSIEPGFAHRFYRLRSRP